MKEGKIKMKYEIVKGILKGNQACFAEIVGVSKQQVSKQIKNNLLKLDPDGKLDLELSVNKWYKYRNDNMIRNNKKKIVSHAEAKETLSRMLLGNNSNNPLKEKKEIMNNKDDNSEFKKAKNYLLGILRNDKKKKVAFIRQLLT